jgi:F-type H+-transporting ATPase subunit delta
MKTATAAGRYAKALFGLAQEDRKTREMREELEVLAGLFDDHKELRDALLTPLHPATERKAVLKAICDLASSSRLINNFCAYLIDQRRLIDFRAICDSYSELADEEAGLTTAFVTTAAPLDDRRKDRLRRALSERTGQEVQLDVTVDEGLIGGAIAKVGDLVFDGSLRTQLTMLRTNLTKGS